MTVIYQQSSLAIVTVDSSLWIWRHNLLCTSCKCWYRAQDVSCESWWAACLSSCWWNFLTVVLVWFHSFSIHSFTLNGSGLGWQNSSSDWRDRHENFINILILGSLHGAVFCETKEFYHSWLCRTTVKSNLLTGPIQTEPFVQNCNGRC